MRIHSNVRCGCKWLLPAGLAMLLSPVAWAGGHSPVSSGAEVFYISDDNVSKSQFDSDRQKDTALEASAHIGYTWAFSFLSALTVTGKASNEQFRDFNGLTNTQGELTADFRFQTRSGFTAPVYSVFVRGTWADFETDIRDGVTGDLGFTITRRLTDRLTGTVGATYSQRRAKGEVFDLQRTRYFVNVDWRLNNTWAVYSTYNYIDGDIFSTATPTLSIIDWADAIEPDNAFGGVANNKFVYRLDAKTRIARLGMNIGLSHSASIDISVDDLKSDAAGPIDYDLTSVSAGILYRF